MSIDVYENHGKRQNKDWNNSFETTKAKSSPELRKEAGKEGGGGGGES